MVMWHCIIQMLTKKYVIQHTKYTVSQELIQSFNASLSSHNHFSSHIVSLPLSSYPCIFSYTFRHLFLYIRPFVLELLIIDFFNGD